MLHLSSTGAMLAAIGRAGEIALEAYTLPRPVLAVLEEAARRGARVTVELEGSPRDDRAGRLKNQNARLVAELRASGVDAELRAGIHAKECRVDDALYLDEKNWRSGDVVLREDDAARAAAISMKKHEALAQEAQLLDRAGSRDTVIVESESFDAGNEVYHALKALGRAGAAPRLLVTKRVLSGNHREHRILEDLMRDGVRVRVCEDSSKLAVAGDRAWLGSANATVTFARDDMTDWGLCTGSGEIVPAVRARLEAEWASASALKLSSRA